jgi:hypothetical protein
MQRFFPIIIIAFCTFATPERATGQVFPREHHSWACFPVGSWKQVRARSETFDEAGRTTSTSSTETKSTLVAVAEDSYTLRVEVTVEVAGKRITAAPRIVHQGLYGQPAEREVQSKVGGEGVVNIGDQEIATKIYQVTFDSDEGKHNITYHVAPDTSPYVLERQMEVLSGDEKEPTRTIHSRVTAVDLPYRVMADTKSTAHIETIRESSRGRSVTVEVLCEEVPGQTVAQWTKELSDKRIIRRSTLELVDYGIAREAVGTATRRYLLPGRAERVSRRRSQ